MNGDVSQGGVGVITGALVEGNVIYDNGAGGGSGINCDGVQNSRFQNNLIYDEHASGISLYQIDAAQPSTGNVIVNNTIVIASDGRWAVNIQDASTGNLVYNNVLLNENPSHGSIDISADSLSGFTSDYNAVMDRFTPNDNDFQTLAEWRAGTGQDQHSFVATAGAVVHERVCERLHPVGHQPRDRRRRGRDRPRNRRRATDLTGGARPQGAGYDVGGVRVRPSGTPTDPPPTITPDDDDRGKGRGRPGQAQERQSCPPCRPRRRPRGDRHDAPCRPPGDGEPTAAPWPPTTRTRPGSPPTSSNWRRTPRSSAPTSPNSARPSPPTCSSWKQTLQADRLALRADLKQLAIDRRAKH